MYVCVCVRKGVAGKFQRFPLCKRQYFQIKRFSNANNLIVLCFSFSFHKNESRIEFSGHLGYEKKNARNNNNNVFMRKEWILLNRLETIDNNF